MTDDGAKRTLLLLVGVALLLVGMVAALASAWLILKPPPVKWTGQALTTWHIAEGQQAFTFYPLEWGIAEDGLVVTRPMNQKQKETAE